VADVGKKKIHTQFQWESERKTPLAESMHKWDNIKMDLNEIGW
jgi:hypothetical protein